MTIPQAHAVTSTRTSKELNRVTVSGYSKNEVVTKLVDRLRYHDTEKANLWAAELVSSGLTELVVNKIITFISSEIHINNPNLPLVILRFAELILSSCTGDVLRCRNQQQVRNAICHIVTLTCLSTKKVHALPKIGEVDFELDYIKSRVVSRSTSIADQILREEDPKDLTVSINELATHIVLKRRAASDKFALLTREVGKLDPAYWLAWLLEWDKHMTSRRLKDVDYRCASRITLSGDDKTATDCVWVIWDLLLKLAESFGHSPTSNAVIALHSLYKLGFSRGKKTERKCILLHAVKCLVGLDADWSRPVETDRPRLFRAVAHVNFIYGQVRKEAILWEQRYRQDKISQFIERTIDSASGGVLDSDDRDSSEIIQAPQEVDRVQIAQSRQDEIEAAFRNRDQMYEPVDYNDRPAKVEPVKVHHPRQKSRPVSVRPMPVIATAHSTPKPKRVHEVPPDCITMPVVCTEGIGCVYVSQDQMLKPVMTVDVLPLDGSCEEPVEEEYREIVLETAKDKRRHSQSETKHLDRAEPPPLKESYGK